MNLTVDIGNSSVKAALFDRGELIKLFSGVEPWPVVDRAIVVSTRGWLPLEIRSKILLRLTSDTPVPIVNRYSTPRTLGMDRLAAAVGATVLFPGHRILVVDFGTAITFDIVSEKNEFLGGSISPGVSLRFRALSEFTDSLPLCTLSDTVSFPAATTHEAIRSGVALGIIAEVEHYIVLSAAQKVIFTGGDAQYFADRVKNTIFATSTLVHVGLNRILDYNA